MLIKSPSPRFTSIFSFLNKDQKFSPRHYLLDPPSEKKKIIYLLPPLAIFIPACGREAAEEKSGHT